VTNGSAVVTGNATLFINTGENASHEAARELVNKSFSVEPPLLDADPNIANWTSANLLRLKSCIDAGGEILVNAALDVLRYRQSTR
jgi:hypothetical protein